MHEGSGELFENLSSVQKLLHLLWGESVTLASAFDNSIDLINEYLFVLSPVLNGLTRYPKWVQGAFAYSHGLLTQESENVGMIDATDTP